MKGGAGFEQGVLSQRPGTVAMRLLFDTVMMASPGGIQLRDELVRSAHEHAPEHCDVVVLARSGASRWPGSDELNVVAVDPPKGRWVGKWRWYHDILPRLAKVHGADVLYSLSGIVSTGLCRSSGVITTCNNMTPFMPEMLRTYPLISRAGFRYAMLRHVVVKSIRRADAVVLHSQHARTMIERCSGDLSAKALVVLTGVPRDMKLDRSAPPSHPYNRRPYFFYLTAIYRYKNHLRLIEAYRQALNQQSSLPDFLVAGLPYDRGYLDEIRAAIAKSGLENRVKYIGVLDRADIPAWIYHADVNFFASLCETNSVILAEILGLGGVLACSNVPPMPEIVSYAAELFDPYSAESMKGAMLRLWNDRHRNAELGSLASKRAAELSWDACGRAIWLAAARAHAAFLERTKK
ncbi:MAG: glycosyltransferase family 1 protein [Phycisphaerae bacterium]|nr:glycosyltransferase family 1 protein [Phycisphaerae bacterium]